MYVEYMFVCVHMYVDDNGHLVCFFEGGTFNVPASSS